MTAGLISLVYWLPACISLINLFDGSEGFFPIWLDKILLPGYFLGLLMGYNAGTFQAALGQLLTLAFLFFIANILVQIVLLLTNKDID